MRLLRILILVFPLPPVQPETATLVFCLITAPLCAVIVVGIVERLRAQAPIAVSAELGPLGSSSTKLDTGTSGIEANVDFVMPFLMFVLPSRTTRTPSPFEQQVEIGEGAPPCETR